jgi:hypothetical protein
MGRGAVKRRKEETKAKQKARNTSTSKSASNSTDEAVVIEATDGPTQVAEDAEDSDLEVPSKGKSQKGKASGGAQRIKKGMNMGRKNAHRIC